MASNVIQEDSVGEHQGVTVVLGSSEELLNLQNIGTPGNRSAKFAQSSRFKNTPKTTKAGGFSPIRIRND